MIDTNAARRDVWFESNDGVRLFAHEASAEGPPILFAHGGLADHRAALFRVGALASSHRLVLPDLRGSGRSVYDGALSWDRLADDLVALLDHLRIARAFVGGTSMGSAVALRFALRHPARTDGVVLLSPLYPGADRPLDDAPRAAMRVMAEAGERARTRGVEALRPLFEGLPPPIRDVAIAMMLELDPASVAATTRFLASNAQPMASARELARIAAPVLLVPGVDPEHPAAIAELYARHLPRATLVDPTTPDLVAHIARFVAANLV